MNYEKDVINIDSIMKAYYEVISGPKDFIVDVSRDKYIHHPNAQIIRIVQQTDNSHEAEFSNIDQYHKLLSYLKDIEFYEWELKRVEEINGRVCNIFSTYAYSSRPNGKIEGMGINSIQLYFDDKRWWVLSELYDSKRGLQELKEKYKV